VIAALSELEENIQLVDLQIIKQLWLSNSMKNIIIQNNK